MSYQLYKQLENKSELKGVLELEAIVPYAKTVAKLFEGVKVSFNGS